jgi:TonB family protein
MPAVVGWRRPVILVPASADTWTPELRRHALLHELAHVERADFFWQSLADLILSFAWFHPLAWYAVHRMRQEAELACDDLVLAACARPSDYAGSLLEVARALRPAPASAVAMTRPSALERRIRAALATNIDRRPARRWWLACLGAAAAAVVLPLSILAAQDDVYKIGGDVTPPVVVYKVEPDYTEEARDAKIEGSVVVSLQVTPQGEPDKLSVERGIDPGLDAKALDAIRQWRFKPAEKGGKPVRVAAKIEVKFRLR